jgi:hypothetical protein
MASASTIGSGPVASRSAQRWSFHEFQHQRRDAAGVFDPVYRGNVRMIERGEQSSFTFKPRKALRLGAGAT